MNLFFSWGTGGQEKRSSEESMSTEASHLPRARFSFFSQEFQTVSKSTSFTVERCCFEVVFCFCWQPSLHLIKEARGGGGVVGAQIKSST